MEILTDPEGLLPPWNRLLNIIQEGLPSLKSPNSARRISYIRDTIEKNKPSTKAIEAHPTSICNLSVWLDLLRKIFARPPHRCSWQLWWRKGWSWPSEVAKSLPSATDRWAGLNLASYCTWLLSLTATVVAQIQWQYQIHCKPVRSTGSSLYVFDSFPDEYSRFRSACGSKTISRTQWFLRFFSRL